MSSPLVRASGAGYLFLSLLSLAIIAWQGRLVEVFGFPGWGGLARHGLTGVLMAVFVLSGSWALKGTFSWARELEHEFGELLGPLTPRDILILAVLSGAVEELFFRVTVQPALGIGLTSLGFGLLHYPMNRRMIPWTVLATLVGLLFGLVYERTGSLLSVGLAHGAVNFFELTTIVASDSQRRRS